MGQANSQAAGAEHSNAKPIGMLVAAVGVVYGDIGTSPLYTLKEVFTGGYGVQVNHDGVFGILALIFWSLVWVVSIKYVLFILRADNQGEGGQSSQSLHCVELLDQANTPVWRMA